MGLFSSIYFNLKGLTISVMICILWIIVLIVPGIYLIVKKHSYNTVSNGTITGSTCKQSSVDSNNYICNVSVNYPANNRSYTGVNIDQKGSQYMTGTNIPVYFDANNPRSFIIYQYRLKTIGITLISLGAVMITITFISYSLKYRNRNSGVIQSTAVNAPVISQ